VITNFSWLLPGTLAGFGLIDTATVAELETLRAQGVGALISLTETPLDVRLAVEAGFRYQHLPVADMRAPSLDAIRSFIRSVDEAREAGCATATHCRAGLGRTGTMLACYLVHEGYSSVQALTSVRTNRPGSVETASQEQVIHEYARTLDISGERVR